MARCHSTTRTTKFRRKDGRCLQGTVLQDTPVSGVRLPGLRAGGAKRGQGTKKTPVIIEASTQWATVGFARMHVVEHVDADTIGNIVRKDIAKN